MTNLRHSDGPFGRLHEATSISGQPMACLDPSDAAGTRRLQEMEERQGQDKPNYLRWGNEFMELGDCS